MSLCDICKKNVAVVFTTRFENNERINEGLCIKCAYDTGLGDIRDMFSAAGINDNNIDEVTERLNRLMSGAETANPQDLFKMLVNDSFLWMICRKMTRIWMWKTRILSFPSKK